MEQLKHPMAQENPSHNIRNNLSNKKSVKEETKLPY